MDLKDRSLRESTQEESFELQIFERDGFVFSSKPIALNNAEQQKALSNDERQISLPVLLLSRCFSFPSLGAKFLCRLW